jgi:hypothetical protein
VKAISQILAREFWQLAGGSDGGYPRDIERAVAFALPVAIAKLPRVTARLIQSWLHDRGIRVLVPHEDRDMAGCLVAHRGVGIIFVCGADPSDELRITIAHEVAHMLLHYLRPRLDAIRSVGPTAIEILDGLRQATVAEQTQAILSSVRLHPHIHLLERGAQGDRRAAGVGVVEREANELALELLAPRAAVLDALRLLEGSANTPHERRLALGRQFGLPSAWFHGFVPDQPHVPADPLGYLFASLRRHV